MKDFVIVSEAQFDKALHSKNKLIKDTNHIIEPPVTFFWDKNFKDMSWGQGAFGAIQHHYDFELKKARPVFYLKPHEVVNES